MNEIPVPAVQPADSMIRVTIDCCADALLKSLMRRRAEAAELRWLREARARLAHHFHAP